MVIKKINKREASSGFCRIFESKYYTWKKSKYSKAKTQTIKKHSSYLNPSIT